MIKSSEEMLNTTNQILSEEGVDSKDMNNPNEALKSFILPGLNSSKDTLSSIYYKSRIRGGFVGKLKTKIQSIIINTVINVVERQSMKQQKFNGLVYKAVETLEKENKELRMMIEELRSTKG